MVALGEGEPATKPERRRRRDTVDDDLEIVPRDVDLEDVVLEVALTADGLKHGGVLRRDLRSGRWRLRRGRCDADEHRHERDECAHAWHSNPLICNTGYTRMLRCRLWLTPRRPAHGGCFWCIN